MRTQSARWRTGVLILMGIATLLFLFFRAGGPPDEEEDQAHVEDGVAITPEFARDLFDRIKELHESDGCSLAKFDTSHFRITVGLTTPGGAVHDFDISTASTGARARRAGAWRLALRGDVARDCGATVKAIEGVLGITAAPRGPIATADLPYHLLAAAFVVLLLGTLVILTRETVRYGVTAPVVVLVLLSAAALVLRLTVSPRTFLHEYYHIAEMVGAYLTGAISPLYGKTGPALFRLVGNVVGHPEDVQVIFLTNAVIASLAIPAVALLALLVVGSWPYALCAAVLLCVLPQHLRFSAAEDLFVLTVTFALWTLALCALYVRSRRLLDAVCCALALALTMQVRPEMLFFPAVLVAFALLVIPHAWRLVTDWRTWLAVLLVAALLVPRAIELRTVLGAGSAPPPMLPDIYRFLDHFVFLQPAVTPPLYWIVLAVGSLWTVWHRPGLVLWVALTVVGYVTLSMSLFDNPPYNLRSQILPTSLLVLPAAGIAPLWLAWWGRERRRAVLVGAAALIGAAVFIVISARGFVTELRDQQLEWAFLERTVPQLPAQGSLLSVIEGGGRNLDAFPLFLLTQAGKRYATVDLRRALSGEAAWPPANGDLLYYQGMFCHFAFHEEPSPDPIMAMCQAVHDRYVAEPLFVEDLHTEGFSHLEYAKPPYRIGFYRLARSR